MTPEILEFLLWFTTAAFVTVAVPVLTTVAIVMVLKNV